jgi:hypothetical protein
VTRRPLTRRTPLQRGKPPRKVNPKRRKSEFARCYHSRQRVRWVKSLPCLVCASISPLLIHCTGPSDNAHTVTDGMGRKAGYDTIVPLCRSHHRRYDEHRAPFDRPEAREWLHAVAARVEEAWLAECRRCDCQTPATDDLCAACRAEIDHDYRELPT